jgi:hypothetical protein
LTGLAGLVLAFSACEHSISFVNPAEKRKESISNYIADEVTATPGKSTQTKWFAFTVQSITTVEAYAGYAAKDAQKLYKIDLTLKNTHSETVPMGLFDFYLDAPDFTEYIWAIPPQDSTMMPERFDFKPGETVRYVLLFEVPQNAAGLSLLYTENDAAGRDGETYSIKIDV